MKILLVNIGKTKSYTYNGKVIKTAFCKEPTTNKIKVNFLGLEGDVQTNKKYHGGITKAVYAYDQSNYNHWKTILKEYDFSPYNCFHNSVEVAPKEFQFKNTTVKWPLVFSLS